MKNIQYILFLCVLTSCLATKKYVTSDDLCAFNSSIFNRQDDKMKIDVSVYEKIGPNQDSILFENKKEVLKAHKKACGNFPEVRYIRTKIFQDRKIRLSTHYYESGKLLYYIIDNGKWDVPDGLAQKTKRYDKDGKLNQQTSIGDTTIFDSISVARFVDINEFTEPLTARPKAPDFEVKYRLDPPKHCTYYSLTKTDKKSGISKVLVYSESGGLFRSGFFVSAKRIRRFGYIGISTHYEDSVWKIIDYEKGYNICFQEALRIAERVGRAEIRKYHVTHFSVGRSVLDKTPDRKPSWTFIFHRDHELGLPPEKLAGKFEKAPYFRTKRHCTIDGVTGEVLDFSLRGVRVEVD